MHLMRMVVAPGFLSSRLWYSSRLELSRYTLFTKHASVRARPWGTEW